MEVGSKFDKISGVLITKEVKKYIENKLDYSN